MISTLKYKTHNDTKINVNGTSHQGEISESFETLLKLFGTPMSAVDNKSDVEWSIMFNDGVVSTIYNWKNGPAFCGNDGINPVNITEWNIGGKTISAVYDIEEIIKNNA
jgi:hypothetical protein